MSHPASLVVVAEIEDGQRGERERAEPHPVEKPFQHPRVRDRGVRNGRAVKHHDRAKRPKRGGDDFQKSAHESKSLSGESGRPL